MAADTILEVDILLGQKDTVWFTDNSGRRLRYGQIVFLANTGQYKLGNGTTTIAALPFYGGAFTTTTWGAITGAVTDSTSLVSYLTGNYEQLSNKGIAGGYVPLDGGAKIPSIHLPSSVMQYQGQWNATTNSPTLVNGIGDTGDVWEVILAGTQNFGAGAIMFKEGDWAVYNGTVWEKSINSNEVVSVNGFTGAITLRANHISIVGYPGPTTGTLDASLDTVMTSLSKLEGNITAATTLTATYVGFGSGLNAITGNSNFTFTEGATSYLTIENDAPGGAAQFKARTSRTSSVPGLVMHNNADVRIAGFTVNVATGEVKIEGTAAGFYNLAFYTNGSKRMDIAASTGNVVIGTGTPISATLAQVTGSGGTIGMSITNTILTGNSATILYIGTDGTRYGSLTRLAPSYVNSYAGTTIAATNGLALQNHLAGTNDAPICIQGTPLYFLVGGTGTNYGAKIDASGFRIDQIQNLHTANAAGVVLGSTNYPLTTTILSVLYSSAANVVNKTNNNGGFATDGTNISVGADVSSGTLANGYNTTLLGCINARGGFISGERLRMIYVENANISHAGTIEISRGGSSGSTLAMKSYGGSMGTNYTGSSIAKDATQGLIADSVAANVITELNGPLVIGGSILYGLVGTTAGNYGYRMDSVGFRVDTLSTLHTANSVPFSIRAGNLHFTSGDVLNLSSNTNGNKINVADSIGANNIAIRLSGNIGDAQNYFFRHYNSTAAGNYTGSSIAKLSTNSLESGDTFAAGHVIGGTPIYAVVGQTGTNYGYRLDAGGLRIDLLSTLHTANNSVRPFDIEGKVYVIKNASYWRQLITSPDASNDVSMTVDNTDVSFAATKGFTLNSAAGVFINSSGGSKAVHISLSGGAYSYKFDARGLRIGAGALNGVTDNVNGNALTVEGKTYLGSNTLATSTLDLESLSNAAHLRMIKNTSVALANNGEFGYTGTKVLYRNDSGVDGYVMDIRSVVSGAATLTLDKQYTYYVFTGTTTTWTLPTVGNNIAFYIKNRGSGAITLNSNAGGTDIYGTSAVASFTINPAEAYLLLGDGTHYNLGF